MSGWLGGLSLVVAFGCDSRFEFDIPMADAGGENNGTSAGSSGSAGAGATSFAGASLGGAGQSSGGSAGSGASSGAGGAGGSAGCGGPLPCPAQLRCVAQACVECAEHADCQVPELSRCDPERHRCVACLVTADCKDDFACDSLAGRCFPECEDEVDCPAGSHGCDERRGVCYKCDEDRECASSPLGPWCASDRSGCVECREEKDCAGQHCDPLSGRCVECRQAADCASGWCDFSTGNCVPP